MLASALIVFREVFEAGLIVGIVLGATRGVAGRGRFVTTGVVGGLGGAALVAVFAGAIADALDGMGQEALNGGILLVAALMLAWHTVWMARHGRELAGEMKALGRAVSDGSRSLVALSIVIGAALLREGAEVVLFLYGLMASGEPAISVAGGSALGVLGGAATAWLLYRGLVAIPTKHLFATTNTLLALLAAGMASQGVGYLIQAELLPALGTRVWDTAWLLSEKSIPGRALHALVGYTDRPAGLQVLTYAVILLALIIGTRAAAPRRTAHA